MILHDLQVAGTTGLRHIHVEHGKISAVTNESHSIKGLPGELHLSCGQAIVFPGLINSHDHLDFDLFPQLGNRVYANYTEWGKDIQVADREAIDRVLKVPKPLRVKWGLYKNLLNGFTTVVNHGERLEIKDALVSVLMDHYALHSPAFEKNWKWKLNDPFRQGKSFVMHIGEGTDPAAEKEIDNVINWNIFKRRIIAVHGVAMNERQAASFAGLVWCPASNYFLLNKTAAVDKLKQRTRIAFGTDSTLTSSWNCWEHIRQAKKTGMLKDDELMAALTTVPAEMWGRNDAGTIEVDKTADMVVVGKREDLFSLNPQDILLVIHRGNIRMFDATLATQLEDLAGKDFGSISVNGFLKYVQGGIAALMDEIKTYGVQANL